MNTAEAPVRGQVLKRIIIIEDERPLAEAVQYSLEKEGYRVDIALDGERGWEMFSEGDYDLVILDLMLPGLDGMEICRRVRAAGAVPVIMLTAKDSDVDKILGLELGADDYVTKPFNMRELVARVRAVLRRAGGEGDAAAPAGRRLEAGEIVLDMDRHEVTVGGEVVEMPLMEYRLLELFDTMLYSADFPEGFRAGAEIRGFRMGASRQPLSERQRVDRAGLERVLRCILSDFGYVDPPSEGCAPRTGDLAQDRIGQITAAVLESLRERGVI